MEKIKNKDVYSSWKFVHMLPELKKVKQGKIVEPINLQIDLTNKCNFRCTHCYYHISNHLTDFNIKDELTEEEALKILYEANDCGLKSVEMTGGGEPLLVPYFVKLSQTARKLNLERALVTNGVHLEKYVNEVKDYSWVRVSMDAINEDVYNQIHRTKKTLEKTKRGLEQLCKVKGDDCIVGVSIIASAENYKEIVELAKYSKNIGADNFRVSLADTPKREKIFKNIWGGLINQIEIAKELQDNNFKVFAFQNRINDIAKTTKGGFCYYHHFTTSVGANGGLYPCCLFKYVPKFNLGNLKEQTFKEIWEGDKRKEFIETTAKDCYGSCWMVEKNAFARYLALDKKEVPHLNFP